MAGMGDINLEEMRENNKILDDFRIKLEEVVKTLGRNSKEYRQMERVYKLISAGSRYYSESIEREYGIDQKLRKILPNLSRDYRKLSIVKDETASKYKEEIENLRQLSKISDKQYEEMIKAAEEYRKELEKEFGEPIVIEYKTKKQIQREARIGEVEKRYGLFRERKQALANILGIPGSKTLSDAAGAFSKKWEAGKDLIKVFSGISKGAKSLTSVLSLLVAGFEFLKKAIVANPIGFLIGALAAFGSVVNEVSTYITNLNKTWKSMAGAPVLIKNYGVEMKKFNDSIYNFSRNLKLGIKAADITEFFKTMAGAGLTTQGLEKRVGDYNKAIETGYKLSMQFGVSFSEMGQMMADQMLNLRSSLDDVSDSFKTMSYDAAVAGVQSQKFYQVVENASMSLSLYGNFLKSTSARLRDFIKSGTMGFKDASQTVQDITSLFKNMSIEQRMGLISLAGGEKAMKAAFEEREKELSKVVEKRKEDLIKIESSPTATKEEKEAAKMQLKAAEANLSVVRQTLRQGDLGTYASQLEYLADDTLGVMTKVMKEANIDFFENRLSAVKFLETWGVSADMSARMFRKATVALDMMTTSAEGLSDDLQDTTKRKVLENIADDIKVFMSGPTKTAEEQKAAMEDFKQRIMVGTGLAKDEAEKLVNILEEGPEMFTDFVDVLLGKSRKKLSQVASEAMARKPQEIEAEMSDDQTKQLVKQTTSLQDYLEITKENAEYALKGNNLMASVALATTQGAKWALGILKFLISNSKERVREKTKDKYQKLAAEKALHVSLAEKYRSGGHLDLAEQEERVIKDISTRMEDIEKKNEKNISELQMAADKHVSDQRKAIDAVSRTALEIAEHQKNINLKTSEEYKNKRNEEQRKLDEESVRASRERIAALEKAQKIYASFINQQPYVEKSVLKQPKAATGHTEVPAKKDFVAHTMGWVKIKGGDLVIDSANLSEGIGLGSGDLRHFRSGVMKSEGRSLSIGPIYLNFNAPLGGEAEDYKKMFVQAINEVVNQRLYKKEQRVTA